MITKEKGYSLNVLVITIAVMLILTSTAVVTLRSLTKDRDISEFMNDIQEVESFVLAYYSTKNILPIVYENGESAPINLPNDLQSQVNPLDKGQYYQVDLSKLGSIKLYDYDRGGYILNENTLKVYVLKPTEYDGVKYYTLTDEILGVNKVYGTVNDFEINITGNPITWTSRFNLMVSIPDAENVNGNWTFKYYKDGPITAEQFTTMGNFFEYGQPLQITQNGVHSIYVENDLGQSRVVNVIVNKIDEVDPYVDSGDGGSIIVGDDELGIAKIHYKIMDYMVPDNVRAQDVKTYLQGPRSVLPDGPSGGLITYKEAYTGERVNGIANPDIGRSILTYRSEYEEYLVRYNQEFYDPSGDVKKLDDEYPQFQREGVPYEDDEFNIVLYVEDYAGNSSVTNKNGKMCVVSREMLINSHFIDTVIKPLKGATVLINDDAEYTNNHLVNLAIRAQGAEQMYITCDENDSGDVSSWIGFETYVENFAFPQENGDVTVYVYVTANQYENGVLIYEKISDTIYLDETAPTQTAPTVEDVGNDLKIFAKCEQKDEDSGIAKIEYAYKLKEDTLFTWHDTLDGIVLEEGQVYEVKTSAVDKAGNKSESEITEVQCPLQVTRTIPNKPAMATGMQAIVWDGTFERPTTELLVSVGDEKDTLVDDPSIEVTWYNYDVAAGFGDTKKSIWANAKTADGSYWVWIPRYAYRLVYYEDSAKTTVKGNYQNSLQYGQRYFEADGITPASDPELVKTKNMEVDIIFMDGKSSTQYKEETIGTEHITIKQLPPEYIVHPAFTGTESSTINNPLGKWSSNVSGIWVSKYEMSRADATIEEVGTSTQIKSVPSVKSYTNIKIGDAYDTSKNMLPALSSHLMKNSEWGAVAYLAHSVYGRNGSEPSANRSSAYLTGGGGSGTSSFTSTPTKFETSYAYNSRGTNKTSGMYASTTGNIYGIYDMVGGTAEYVSSYLKNSDSNIQLNGQTMTQTTNPEFREVFGVADNDQPINNYKKAGIQDSIYGNALYETSNGYDSNDGINADTSKFPYNTLPFFTRGGEAASGSGAGLFNFDRASGAAAENIGFRAVLAFD